LCGRGGFYQHDPETGKAKVPPFKATVPGFAAGDLRRKKR